MPTDSTRAEPRWERLAAYMRHAMAERGWTQADLAAHAEVSTKTVDRLLHARDLKRLPTKVAQIEQALGWEPMTAQVLVFGPGGLDAGQLRQLNTIRNEAVHGIQQAPNEDRPPPRYRDPRLESIWQNTAFSEEFRLEIIGYVLGRLDETGNESDTA